MVDEILRLRAEVEMLRRKIEFHQDALSLGTDAAIMTGCNE